MNETVPWSPQEFEAQLRALGSRYHIHHPYHQRMHAGELSREQLQGWVANRYYYQICIPRKDAALLANCDDREVRRLWVERILEHDGQAGGIEAWLSLAQACGLDRETVISQCMVLPGVRFAVDAYVNFVARSAWPEAVCSSLTELFAPSIHQQRIADWPQKYPWVDPQGLDYFRGRVTRAHADVEHALAITLEHFTSHAQQLRALQILRFKLDVLWSMLDAMYMAYVHGMPPYFNVTDA